MKQVTPNLKGQKRPRKPSTATLKRRATTLHSRYVRARDGCCRRCGKADGVMHCAHIVSRRYAATRTDENNAVCLCYTCHRRLTEHPDEHVQFATNLLGFAGYAALRAKAYAGAGQTMRADFWAGEATRLAALLKAAAGVSKAWWRE